MNDKLKSSGRSESIDRCAESFKLLKRETIISVKTLKNKITSKILPISSKEKSYQDLLLIGIILTT